MRGRLCSIALSPALRMKSGAEVRRIRFVAWALFLCVGTSSAGGLTDNMEQMLDRLESNCSAFGKPSPKRYLAQGTVMQMDSDWKPETVARIEKEVTFLDSNRQETIIKAVRTGKDGKEEDITREMVENDRKNRKGQKDKNKQGHSLSMGSEELFVFAKEKRGGYDFSWLSDSLLDGRRVARLSAVPKKKDVERFRMTYAIHPDSMTVLLVEMRPSKNPKMVRQLLMTLRLSQDSDGHYFMRRFWMRVFVNLIVKKIRTEVSEEYSGLQY
jgi:hypothetical protein